MTATRTEPLVTPALQGGEWKKVMCKLCGNKTWCTAQAYVKDGIVLSIAGDPENPMSDEAFVSKFMDCARHSRKKFSKRGLNRIVESILNLEEIKDISELTRYL